MRYYIIAGEASGDQHAAQLIEALRQHDPQAQIRGIGGEAMQAQGAQLHCHYRALAHMGFLQVLRHLPSLLRTFREVKADIRHFRPHLLLLVDAPGFNLRLARWAHRELLCPVAYYILPKTWASRPHRNRQLLAHTQLRLSILPFEPPYFDAHGISTHYVGNPTYTHIQHFLAHDAESREEFFHRHHLDPSRPLVALLPGSRRAEIRANLPRMLQALRLADAQGHCQILVAQAPSLDTHYYNIYAREPFPPFRLLQGATLSLLHHAQATLVTSGTATLEAALLSTPQVVCYHLRGGFLIPLLRRLFLRCPYISLVNLIAQRPLAPELVGGDASPQHIADQLAPLLVDSPERQAQLQGIAQLPQFLTSRNAAHEAAQKIMALLKAQA